MSRREVNRQLQAAVDAVATAVRLQALALGAPVLMQPGTAYETRIEQQEHQMSSNTPRQPDDKIKGGMSKVQRYGWKVLDAPGELMWIEKTELLIDHTYQRDHLSQVKIQEIAANWSWMALGVILVARRQGKFYVYAGQHRTEAAMKRSDITKLPCLVFETSGAEEEAEAFIREATKRKALTAIDTFKAKLAVGDEHACMVDALVRGAGRVISRSTSSGTVRCIGQMQGHAKNNPEELQRLWPLIVKVCEGHPLHERILDGLMYIESHMPAGQSLRDKVWSDRVLRVGYVQLLAAAARMAAAYTGGGGARVWAVGMVDAINHGCRNRLQLTGSDD